MIVLNTSDTTTRISQMQHGTIDEIIAKIQLGTRIIKIALACPACQGPANQEIQEFKNRNSSHQGGGRSSLPAMNDKKNCITNDITLEYT
jgi:hypothetical protein